MKVDIYLRDLDGRREVLHFHNQIDFINNFKKEYYNEDNYEILMVVWGEHCLYSGLSTGMIDFDDLICFFA